MWPTPHPNEHNPRGLRPHGPAIQGESQLVSASLIGQLVSTVSGLGPSHIVILCVCTSLSLQCICLSAALREPCLFTPVCLRLLVTTRANH